MRRGALARCRLPRSRAPRLRFGVLWDGVGGGDGAEGVGDVTAFAEVEAAGGGGKGDGVGDDALDVGVVIDGECLVAGAEVDDFAFAAAPGAAAAKDFAAFEPAYG